MGCGCKAEKVYGGTRRRNRSRRRMKKSSRARKRRRVMKGGSLLGDQLTNMSNFTSGLVGSSGMPFLQFNPPANMSYNDGNRYIT